MAGVAFGLHDEFHAEVVEQLYRAALRDLGRDAYARVIPGGLTEQDGESLAGALARDHG